MNKIKNLTTKTKVGALASGAAMAATLATAPVAGATPAAPPAQPPAGDLLRGTTIDTPMSGQPDAILGHSRPDSVTVGDNGNSRTFHWHWNIEHGQRLDLPAWEAPKDTPYIATNSKEKGQEGELAKVWEADMTVQASEGVGYSGFRVPSEKQQALYMTGWPQGDFFSNSVWASLIHDGWFDLTVTTTRGDGSDVGAARELPVDANAGQHRFPQLLFPWVEGRYWR
ncbi:MAG TPA: hypothetical protein VGF64_17735 [Acidimicrobiales bacterium]|jgi:hypothetical protein